MTTRILFGWLILGALGCGAPTDPDPDGDGDGDADSDIDADADGDNPGCVDQDGDGFGIGDGCDGDDCDDADAALTNDCGAAGLCADGIHVTGCPCTDQQPVVCYTGPADTAGIGPCRPGLRDCVEGAYGPCANQVAPMDETCDDVDQDCDGTVDDGVRSECGTCSADCSSQAVGVGSENPFDPDSPGARGVVQNPDGSLTLGGSVVIANKVIWIANSGEGTVAKVDTETNEELGRYYTDPGMSGDPSRSTVNPHGDVISANRGASTATFIMASDCPDQDGDGVVETSTGPADILPFDEDECIIWNLPIEGGGARGSAIQERVELDGSLHEYAFVGALYSGDMYEIDVEAGELTGREFNTSPATPYGAAMAEDGTLWVTTSGSNMAKVDTETLDITQYTAPPGKWFYGITVDRDGYVWLSGGTGAMRFDPETEEYTLVENNGGCGGGIAADVNGIVWTGHGYICSPAGVSRIDPETMTAEVIQTGGDTHGVAIDFDGFVWGINVNGGNAHKIDPETLDFEVAWESGTAWGYNYTYSDMTGYQLINATQELATYAWIFSGCQDAAQDSIWTFLHWDADVPPGTSVRFTARTADTLDALAAAPLVTVAAQPPDLSPVDIREAFAAAGVEHGEYLELEASLSSATREARPTLTSFEVFRACEGLIQ